MKTFVVFTDGFQEASNMDDARQIARNNHTNYIAICDNEDEIYATETEKIYNW